MRGKTADEKLKIQTLRNTLAHRIKKWRTIQVLYTPIVTTYLSKDEDGGDDDDTSNSDSRSLPEDEKLWMPSSLPRETWTASLSPGLLKKEERLRIAEADDALHQVRFFPSSSTIAVAYWP